MRLQTSRGGSQKSPDVDVANVHSISDIADQWWVLSSKATAEEYLFKMRAKSWYDEYRKLVSAADIPKKIEKRLEELTLGVGFTSLPPARSPSNVLLLDWDKAIAGVTVAESSQLAFLGNRLLGIVSKEDRLGDDTTRFRILRIASQTALFDDSAEDFINHSLVTVVNQVAWLRPREGIFALDWRALSASGQNSNPNLQRFRAPKPIRAFDIGDKGDIFALADKFICWWNPQQAWGNPGSGQRNPTQFDSTVPFIANRIRVIPNSSLLALSNSRNLVRLNPVSKGISDLHTGSELNDYDFSANGTAVAIALNNGVRYKSLKGGKDLFFQTMKATQVRFLPGSRFLISLHQDHSIRVWDTSEKQKDYLIERYDSPEFLPEQFAISPDGQQLVAIDDSSQIRLFDLFYD